MKTHLWIDPTGKRRWKPFGDKIVNKRKLKKPKRKKPALTSDDVSGVRDMLEDFLSLFDQLHLLDPTAYALTQRRAKSIAFLNKMFCHAIDQLTEVGYALEDLEKTLLDEESSQ